MRLTDPHNEQETTNSPRAGTGSAVSAAQLAFSFSLAGVASENRACLPAGRARLSGRGGVTVPSAARPDSTVTSASGSTGNQKRARLPSGSGPGTAQPTGPATALVSRRVRAS
jgi:hypothetical protein